MGACGVKGRLMEMQKVKGSPLSPILNVIYGMEDYAAGFVLYLHPSYLRRIRKEITTQEIYGIAWQEESRSVMGVPFIESDFIPEIPGWFILPKYKERCPALNDGD